MLWIENINKDRDFIVVGKRELLNLNFVGMKKGFYFKMLYNICWDI